MAFETSYFQWSLERLQSINYLGRTLDYPLEAIRFILDMIVESSPVCTSDIAEKLRIFAVESFGDDARKVLQDWRISRSEDVGVIVDALVTEGLLVAQDGDSLDHFQGQFNLDSLFPKHP